MPASRARIQLDDELVDLFCPACAAPVLAEGNASEELCEHVRFLIDPSGEISLADPEGVPDADRPGQERLLALVESTETWDDFLTQAVKELPESALVLELEGPAGEDEEDEGAQAVVAFDMAASG